MKNQRESPAELWFKEFSMTIYTGAGNWERALRIHHKQTRDRQGSPYRDEGMLHHQCCCVSPKAGHREELPLLPVLLPAILPRWKRPLQHFLQPRQGLSMFAPLGPASSFPFPDPNRGSSLHSICSAAQEVPALISVP